MLLRYHTILITYRTTLVYIQILRVLFSVFLNTNDPPTLKTKHFTEKIIFFSKRGYSEKKIINSIINVISRKERKLLLSKTEEKPLNIKMSRLQNSNPASKNKKRILKYWDVFETD